jgi:hypothetical protein
VSYMYALIASGVLAFCITLVGMMLLTRVCPNFFYRLNWSALGLHSDGIYDYEADRYTDGDERELEQAWFWPMVAASAGAAVVCSWTLQFFDFSLFGIVCWTVPASLVPMIFLFLVLGLGALLKFFDVSLGWRISDWQNPEFKSASKSSFSKEPVGEPTCFGDRVDNLVYGIGTAARKAPGKIYDRSISSLRARWGWRRS